LASAKREDCRLLVGRRETEKLRIAVKTKSGIRSMCLSTTSGKKRMESRKERAFYSRGEGGWGKKKTGGKKKRMCKVNREKIYGLKILGEKERGKLERRLCYLKKQRLKGGNLTGECTSGQDCERQKANRVAKPKA